jgi:Fe-S cluster biosynthesis and repair protein YggX
MELLLEFEVKTKDTILESDGRLRFDGVAMFENAMSGNGRFYPASFIDESISRTEQWVAAGHKITIHRSHEAWRDGDMPIGKAENLRHENGAMAFKAQLSKTRDGSDMAVLVQDEVIARMSLRSTQFESETVQMESNDGKRPVELMKWAVIEGIDFCEYPGISGAGITQILESAPQWAKENTMEWNEVTLETLRENRPDLLEGYLREALGAFVAERDDLKVKVAEGATTVEALNTQIAELTAKATDTTELDTAKAQVETLVSAAKDLEWMLARFEAAAPRWVAGLVEEVAQCDPAVLAKEVSEKKDAILASFLAEREPKGKGENLDEDREGSMVPDAGNLVSPAVLLNTH